MTARALSDVSKSRVDALKQKHLAMEAKIEELQKSPSIDSSYLKTLKMQKLFIKEEISGLSTERKSTEKKSA